MKINLILLTTAALAVSADSHAMFRRAPRASVAMPHAQRAPRTQQLDNLIKPRGWDWKKHVAFVDERLSAFDMLYAHNAPQYRKTVEKYHKAYQEAKKAYALQALPAHRADYRVSNKHDYLCSDLAYANSSLYYKSAKDMIQSELKDMLAEQKRELKLRDDIQ